MTAPAAIVDLYRDQGWLAVAFVHARWLLCPFPELSNLLPRQGRIADVGCGVGLFANWLALEGPDRQVVGFDADEKALRVAKRTVGERPNISFEVLDAAAWNEVNAYDAIALVDLVHHILPARLALVMRQVHAALKPGGILLLKDVDEKPLWKVWASFLHDFIQGHRPFFLNVREQEDLIRSVGFRIERVVSQPLLYVPHLTFLATK